MVHVRDYPPVEKHLLQNRSVKVPREEVLALGLCPVRHCLACHHARRDVEPDSALSDALTTTKLSTIRLVLPFVLAHPPAHRKAMRVEPLRLTDCPAVERLQARS